MCLWGGGGGVGGQVVGRGRGNVPGNVSGNVWGISRYTIEVLHTRGTKTYKGIKGQQISELETKSVQNSFCFSYFFCNNYVIWESQFILLYIGKESTKQFLPQGDSDENSCFVCIPWCLCTYQTTATRTTVFLQTPRPGSQKYTKDG